MWAMSVCQARMPVLGHAQQASNQGITTTSIV